jgi:hypothetical protein
MARRARAAASDTTLQAGQRRRKLRAVIGHIAALGTTPRIEAEKQRKRAREAILMQMGENLRLLGETDPQNERTALTNANHTLTRALKRLDADQLKEINESNEIADAIKKLTSATDALVAETKKTRNAEEAIRAADAVVNLVAAILGLLAPFK